MSPNCSSMHLIQFWFKILIYLNQFINIQKDQEPQDILSYQITCSQTSTDCSFSKRFPSTENKNDATKQEKPKRRQPSVYPLTQSARRIAGEPPFDCKWAPGKSGRLEIVFFVQWHLHKHGLRSPRHKIQLIFTYVASVAIENRFYGLYINSGAWHPKSGEEKLPFQHKPGAQGSRSCGPMRLK